MTSSASNRRAWLSAAAALDLVTPVLVLRDGDLYPVDGWTVLEGVGEMRDPEAPAVIVLTSATTGRPKGVVLSSRALAASAESWLGALPPATGWVLALGIGHVAGLGILWRAITGRVPVQIVGPADPAALLAALAAEPGMSHVSLVPAQLARVLDAAGDGPPIEVVDVEAQRDAGCGDRGIRAQHALEPRKRFVLFRHEAMLGGGAPAFRTRELLEGRSQRWPPGGAPRVLREHYAAVEEREGDHAGQENGPRATPRPQRAKSARDQERKSNGLRDVRNQEAEG